jgi:hypothetical protein
VSLRYPKKNRIYFIFNMINEYFGISKTYILIIFLFFFQNDYPILAI